MERFSTTSAPEMACTCGFLAGAQGHADAIGLDEPAGLVGDQVGNLGRIQAAVNLPGEGLELHPDLLLADHLPELMIARVAGGEGGHAHQELQELAHGVRAAHRVMPDLDHAGHLLVVDDGGQQDEQIGGVARPLVAGLPLCGGTMLRRRPSWPPAESARRASAGCSRVRSRPTWRMLI